VTGPGSLDVGPGALLIDLESLMNLPFPRRHLLRADRLKSFVVREVTAKLFVRTESRVA
jgi:hypothetical protein